MASLAPWLGYVDMVHYVCMEKETEASLNQQEAPAEALLAHTTPEAPSLTGKDQAEVFFIATTKEPTSEDMKHAYGTMDDEGMVVVDGERIPFSIATTQHDAEQGTPTGNTTSAQPREKEAGIREDSDTPSSANSPEYGRMDYGELVRDPVAGPLLEQEALSVLRKQDSQYFDKEYTGELDEAGYLIRKDGDTPITKPIQNISGGLLMQQVLENTQKRLVEVGYSEPQPSQEVRPTKPEDHTAVEHPVDSETVFEELQERLKPEQLKPIELDKQPIVDSKVFKDSEYGLEQKSILQWVQTDKIVGRPSASAWQDGWAHEYENRTGRIEEIRETLVQSDDTALEQVFHTQEHEQQRIKLAAYDGPEGPVYDVADGSHRIAGVMSAGLAEFPADVRHMRFPFAFIGRDENQAIDIKKKIDLGLIRGSVVEQQDAQGNTMYEYNIENEVVPWIHTTSQTDLIKISRAYENLYPGALDALPVPRDVLVDPIAQNYFIAGQWEEWEEKFQDTERDENGIVQYY